MTLSNVLSIEDMKKPKAKPYEPQQMIDRLERLVWRAKFCAEPISLETLDEFLIDLRECQFEDEGAADILDEIHSMASGYSRRRWR